MRVSECGGGESEVMRERKGRVRERVRERE